MVTYESMIVVGVLFSIGFLVLLTLALIVMGIFMFVKIGRIEGYLAALTESVDDELGENGPQMWHTTDGRFSAHSMEELIQKITSDPNQSAETKAGLEKFMNEINKDEDDDEDEEEEKWKKGKP